VPEPRGGVALRAPRVYVWSESARDVLSWDLDLIRFAESLARAGRGARPPARVGLERRRVAALATVVGVLVEVP
jgi:hypothetical protein